MSDAPTPSPAAAPAAAVVAGAAAARRRRRRRWVVIALALLAAIVAVVLWRARPVAVAAVQLARAPLVQTLQFSGRVATRSRADVGSTLTGRIEAVLVREGDRVAAGAPLLRLDRRELDAALLQARANLTQAESRIVGLRGSGREGVRAGLAQAQSNLAAAEAELRRSRELLAQGFISQARLDEAQRALGVARAQRDAAQAQLAANADGGSELAQALAQQRAAQAAVEAAAAHAAQAEIVAPAPAQVLVRAAEPGQIVQPGRALLTLALEGPVELVAQVDERFLDRLRVDQRGAALADAFERDPFPVRVATISPQVDAARGAVEVKLQLLQPPPAFLREDMTVSIEIETGRRADALVLPAAALRPPAPGAGAEAQAGDRASVLRIEDGRARAAQVQLGLRTLAGAEVMSGLAPGDVVLLEAVTKPGDRVRADLEAGARRRAQPSTREDAGTAALNSMGR